MPEFLHLLDQAGFRIARRRLGEVLAGVHVAAGRADRARAIGGSIRSLVLLRRVVLVFAVQLQEAVEGDDRAGGAQGSAPCRRSRRPSTWSSSADCIWEATARFQISSYSRRWSGLRTVPRSSGVRATSVGRIASCASCAFFALAGVFARRAGQVVGAERAAHMVADGVDRLARHLHAVGTHVGDQAGGLAVDVDAFVQLLRQPHGLLRAEAELAGGLLLQGGGGERRRRVAPDPLALDRADGEARPPRPPPWPPCASASVLRSNWSSRLPSRWVSRAVNGAPPGVDEQRLDGPVFARAEDLDLGFALADQAQRDRLHPPGAAAAGQLAPQHRATG